MTAEPRPARAPAPCPICGAPSTPEARPFCSPRCANVDLGRWLKGAYAIPVTEEDEPGRDSAQDPSE